MTDTIVHLRWDGVCIPANEQAQPRATRLWRNSAALGACALTLRPPDRVQLRLARVMHDTRADLPVPVLRQQLARVSIFSTTDCFAPGQEWVWIKASIRDIGKVGCLVLQIRDKDGVLVYTERLSRQQVWSLPTGLRPPTNTQPPLRHAPNEPPANAQARAGLAWANPAGSPYQVTILTSTTPQDAPDSIAGVPALNAPIPVADQAPTCEANTTLRPGLDQTEVQIASVSLELVPWRELYETSTGASVDVVPPDGADRIKWVQYKLNELGWFAGKLDGDANNVDLKRAVIRYRQSHKTLKKTLFEEAKDGAGLFYRMPGVEYSSAIDGDFMEGLRSNPQPRPTSTPGVFTQSDAEGKIYLDAERFCEDANTLDEASDTAKDAVDAPSTNKYDREQQWLSTPRFPLRAKIQVMNSRGMPVWAPGASQSIDVQWSWQDRPEQTAALATHPSTTKAYIDQAHTDLRDRFPSNFHNARDVVGGQISQDADENQAVVFDDVHGGLTRGPEGAITIGELVFFSPSKIAGDNYRITATAGGQRARTGWMTLWRRVHVTGHVSWGGTPTPVWTDVAAKYAPAYVEIVAPETLKTMAEIVAAVEERETRDESVAAEAKLKEAFKGAFKEKFLREFLEKYKEEYLTKEGGEEGWSDDAWDPRRFSYDMFTDTTPEAMTARLVDILNGGDQAYDRWNAGEDVDIDISARYKIALDLVKNHWFKGKDDPELGDRRLTTKDDDLNLLEGARHYENELKRICKSPRQQEPARLSPAVGKKAPFLGDIRGTSAPTRGGQPALSLEGLEKPPFHAALAHGFGARATVQFCREPSREERKIKTWGGGKDDARLKKKKEEKISELIKGLITATRPLVLLHLHEILGPGAIVLEFEPHAPVDEFTSKAQDNMMAGGGKIVINRACLGPYRSGHLFSHELAHALFLKHYKNAPDHVQADHDQSDDNCVMSYIRTPQEISGRVWGNAGHYADGQYEPEFCGKCNLKLRGWNIRAKHEDADALPARSRS